MGYKMIQTLLENENLEDVIFQLNNERKGFKELLANHEIKPDIIVLVIKLLGKICGCSFRHSIVTIMETALRSSFADNAVNYISKLALQVSISYKNLYIILHFHLHNLLSFSLPRNMYLRKVLGCVYKLEKLTVILELCFNIYNNLH